MGRGRLKDGRQGEGAKGRLGEGRVCVCVCEEEESSIGRAGRGRSAAGGRYARFRARDPGPAEQRIIAGFGSRAARPCGTCRRARSRPAVSGESGPAGHRTGARAGHRRVTGGILRLLPADERPNRPTRPTPTQVHLCRMQMQRKRQKEAAAAAAVAAAAAAKEAGRGAAAKAAVRVECGGSRPNR
jgi:hypothetical protein